MQRSLRMPTIAFAFLAGFLSGISAEASTFFLHPWESHASPSGQLTFQPSGQFYLGRTNYDSAGALFFPSGLTQYARLQGDLALGYGFWGRLTLFGRLSLARVQVDGTSRPGANTGLADQALGLNLKILELAAQDLFGGVTVELQAQGEGPLYSNVSAESVLAPYLGDGTFDFSGGFWVKWPVWRLRDSALSLQGGGAYAYRTNGLSQALPWAVKAELQPAAAGLTASLGLAGYQSLQTDARLGAVNPTAAALGTGGFFASNAIDPTLVSVRASVGYRLSRDFAVEGLGGLPVYGQLAPAGIAFGIGLQARLGEPDSPSTRKSGPQEYTRSNRGFVRYDLEARVLRTNDRLSLLKIDRGVNEGVEVGQIFDIFSVRIDGRGGEAVARAKVTSVRASESALEVEEYYREVWIEEGFSARRLVPE